MPLCCIVSCTNKETLNDITFHKFPKDSEILNKWLAVCGKNVKSPTSRYNVVCSRHFIESDFQRDLQSELLGLLPRKRILKPDAIPTVNLPSMSSLNEDSKHSVSQIIEESIAKSKNELFELNKTEVKWRTQVGILCRLCAKSDYACVSILLGKGSDLNLKSKILKYIHLEVDKDDKLPDQVCPLCLSAIISWHEYADVCNTAAGIKEENKEIDWQDITSANIKFTTEETGHTVMIKSEPNWGREIESSCCLCKKSDENLISINSEEVFKFHLQVNIKKYLETDVQDDDHVCYPCMNAVNSWHEFVERCLLTNEKLQELLHVEDDVEHVLKRINEIMRQKEADEYIAQETQNNAEGKKENITIKEEEIEEVAEGSENINKSNQKNESFSEVSDANPQKQDQQNSGEYSSESESSSDNGVDSDENFSDWLSKKYLPMAVVKLFQCNVCLTEFPNYLSLAAHKMAAHNRRTCQCKLCFVVFDTPDHVTKHEKKKHKWKVNTSDVNTCPICKKQILQREFRYHLTFHETFCLPCGEVYVTREAYEEHLMNHQKGFSCDKCGRQCTSKSRLLTHYKTHLPDELIRKFNCKKCNKSYRTKLGYKKHIDCTHNIKFVAKCDICDKVFTDKNPYTAHIAIVHTVTRPYACDLCDKAFKCKSTLRQHINNHNIIREEYDEYSCTICQKMFSSKAGLMIHMNYHSDETARCLCHVCGVSFRNNKTLAYHLINHDENRPYKFYSKPLLKKLNKDNPQVQWTHGNKKRFFCSICDKGFTTRSYLIKHICAHS